MTFLCFVLILMCKETPETKSLQSQSVVDPMFIDVYPDTIISQLSDSTYFRDLESLRILKNRLYFTDFQNSRVICLDRSSLKILFEIDKKGNGPGEFQFPARFFIFGDSIYIHDEAKQQIEVYDIDGGYGRNFNFPVLTFSNFAVDSHGNFYVNTIANEFPISVYDLKGKKINQFGRWLMNEKNTIEKRSRNSRHLVTGFKDSTEYLIGVYLSEPILELYTLEGKLVQVVDLSELSVLEDRIRFIEDNYREKGTTLQSVVIYKLFTSVYCDTNNLYLAYASEEGITNNILLLNLRKLQDNQIEIKNLQLKSQKGASEQNAIAIGSFAVEGNQIYFDNGVNYTLYRCRFGI